MPPPGSGKAHEALAFAHGHAQRFRRELVEDDDVSRFELGYVPRRHRSSPEAHTKRDVHREELIVGDAYGVRGGPLRPVLEQALTREAWQDLFEHGEREAE